MGRKTEKKHPIALHFLSPPRAELLEAWLELTSVKYHDNLLILMLLNKWLALTMLRATGPRCINGNQQIALVITDKMLGGNLRWTSIPSRGSTNTPGRFILQTPEISAGTDEPSGSPNYDWGQA